MSDNRTTRRAARQRREFSAGSSRAAVRVDVDPRGVRSSLKTPQRLAWPSTSRDGFGRNAWTATLALHAGLIAASLVVIGDRPVPPAPPDVQIDLVDEPAASAPPLLATLASPLQGVAGAPDIASRPDPQPASPSADPPTPEAPPAALVPPTMADTVAPPAAPVASTEAPSTAPTIAAAIPVPSPTPTPTPTPVPAMAPELAPPLVHSTAPPPVTAAHEPARPKPPAVVPRPRAEARASAPARRGAPSEPQASGPQVTEPSASASQASLPASASVAPPSPVAVDGPWRGLLAAWLAAHRRYPEAARERGDEGTTVLRFTVERSGEVTSVTVVQGSGSPELDDAATSMVRGARLPPFPPDMTQASQTVTVPVRYRLVAR